MNGVIGDILPLALCVAISPIPIIAAILMLFSPRAAGTGSGFLVGGVLGIIAVTSVFTAVSDSLTAGGEPSATSSWIKIVLGVLLLLLGARNWRGRNAERATPKWMSTIDSFTPVKAFGLGFLLSAINPKNLLMGIAAGVAIGGAGISLGQEVVAIAVFTVIAASTARSFTGRLRRAIEVRDRHCQHPSGCDVPVERCDVDPIVPDSLGGKTTQFIGRLACRPHHRDAWGQF